MLKKTLKVGAAHNCLFWLFSLAFAFTGMVWTWIHGINWIISPVLLPPPPLWFIVLILTSIIIVAVILIRMLKNSTIKEAVLMCLISLIASVITSILIFSGILLLILKVVRPDLGSEWFSEGAVYIAIVAIYIVIIFSQPLLFYAIILTLVYLVIRKLWINYVQKH